MLTLRIAFRNLTAHKRSSFVLFTIFFIVSFIIFWVFGFINTVNNAIQNGYRSLYGDLYFSIDYSTKARLHDLLDGMNAHSLELENFPSAMIDFGEKSVSDTVRPVLSESGFSLEYVKVSRGRMPENAGEINVPESFVADGKWQGEYLYVSAITPGKVMNTMRYEIVGTNKLFFFLHESGIAELSNGTQSANVISMLSGRRTWDTGNGIEGILGSKCDS